MSEWFGRLTASSKFAANPPRFDVGISASSKFAVI